MSLIKSEVNTWKYAASYYFETKPDFSRRLKNQSNPINLSMGRRLTKSVDQKMLFGVCGGIAEFFGFDVTLVRLVFVFLSLVGLGSPILIYIILGFVMPQR